ncbi:MAG: HDOD domain-containing protein [Candidatus Kapabacteria bacterium]|nr:HDOD domain-containing protein [Ignavibacteriota bacterium]MCW5883353.1 HDOD domain-containing protein [Candidatus Kapabacteria bacterium]
MIDKVNYYLYKSNQFPTLPTIYTSLMTVISNPRSSIQDLADVIMKDQASVIKLLKVVNSPLFGIKSQITTVNQAILYLGFNEVKNILLALSVMDVFDKINNADKFNVIDLWKHSIGVAVTSRILANSLGIKDVENYFIAGIIHDIGKLFYIHFFPNEYSEIIELASNAKISISKFELNKFGMTHEQVGAELARKWNLPTALINTIEYHERGKYSNRTDSLLACVHLANIIACLMKLGNTGDNYIPEPAFEIWNILNFSAGTLKSKYEEINVAFNMANSILQLKV